LEKKLRFKTVERFGGKKGDLTKAVEEAVKTWVAKEKETSHFSFLSQLPRQYSPNGSLENI
jgi:hypothetical protein